MSGDQGFSACPVLVLTQYCTDTLLIQYDDTIPDRCPQEPATVPGAHLPARSLSLDLSMEMRGACQSFFPCC